MPDKSPGIDITGPEELENPFFSSLAIIFANVVFPKPGGP